ncbi:hypothetical protein [Persicirhabdus sediminis]|uniref:Neurotransmitter-gated ion-channel ligand binding domain-containing protein n=1 Tax=Persicirhabdus sediminis TaxID=454144 RepID=A0A8J7MD53_9BACT|nr:hypothetical protein [Persicirhabdus sediminis]MBK1790372.1 hypothetical protein [Persicirhabdus sediminis]
MKRLFVLLFLWLTSISAMALDLDQDDLKSLPESGGGPVKVWVRFALIDIEQIDSAKQNFTVNYAYMVRWQDDRLKHDAEHDVVVDLGDIWYPQIQITNQQKLFKTLPEEANVSPNGEVLMIQRVWGNLSQPLDLRNFPFDKQHFYIKMMAAGDSHQSVVLVKDDRFPSGLAKKFSLPDWEITGWDVELGQGALFDDLPKRSVYIVDLQAQRSSNYYVVKVMSPLVFIVMMSWIVFWVDAAKAGPQIGVATTSMLTLIAYRFAIGKEMPQISYITRMDGFVFASTVLVFVTLILAVTTAVLAQKEKAHIGKKIDRVCRWLVPMIFIYIAWHSLVYMRV